jgi:hypothetical protein
VFIDGEKLSTTVGVEGVEEETKTRSIAREVTVRVIRMTSNGLKIIIIY